MCSGSARSPYNLLGALQMRRTFRAALIVVMLGMSSAIEASPITWYLDGVTFDDGSTAIGSFLFDASVGTFGSYTDASIDVIEKSDGSVFHYSSNGFGQGNFHEVFFVGNGVPGPQPQRTLFFDLAPGLMFAAGVTTFDPFFSVEYLYSPSGAMTDRNIVAGSITTTPVPEPSSLLLLSSGVSTLIAASWGWRRNRYATTPI